jgi:hypothetical protein
MPLFTVLGACGWIMPFHACLMEKTRSSKAARFFIIGSQIKKEIPQRELSEKFLPT